MIAHQYSHTFLHDLIRKGKSTISKDQVSMSIHRLKRADFTIVHSSSSVGTRLDVAFDQKLDCELSDKVFVLDSRHMAAAQQVFMLPFSSCNSTELKHSMGP